LAFRGEPNGLSAPLDLTRHSRRYKDLPPGQITYQVKISGVSDYYVAFQDSGFRPFRTIVDGSRPYSDYVQFSLAIATVTPFDFRFGTINSVLLPASIALGSATPGSPNCE